MKNLTIGTEVKSKVAFTKGLIPAGTNGKIINTFKPIHSLGCWDVTIQFEGFSWTCCIPFDNALTGLEVIN